MTRPALHILGVALLALVVSSASALADPMKCSGEEKACITSCQKTARVALSVCLTGCGQRVSACMKTGCWDNGASRYCGLAKL